MRERIITKLAEIFSELGVGQRIKDGSALLRDMGLDSLRMVMLIIKLEEKFGILLDEADMNPFAFTCVDDIAALVEKYVGDERK